MEKSATIAITTSIGDIVGVSTEERCVFRGIPYAQAPVAKLRMAAPVRRAAFATPFEAFEWGATPQQVPLFDDTFIPEPSVPGEDTLNLNIFTPKRALPGGNLPVLVWVHGGGYRTGSAIGEWFHGESLNRHNIVMVSVSYRLGVDGWGWIDGTSNNRGLRDLIVALEWVQEHIADFGGDPSRVTIAGQSAGGGAVLALASSPLACDLFSQAWSMSGVLHGFPIDVARQKSQEFAAHLGVEATVGGLSHFTNAELQEALADDNPMGERSLSRGPADRGMSLAPVVGDDVLPQSILHGIETYSSRKRLVVGATADEFVSPSERPVSREQFRKLVESWEVDAQFIDSYIDMLGDDKLIEGRVSTDALFRAAVAALMRVRLSAEAQTWAYDFRWVPPNLGVSGHCADVPFFFNVARTAYSLNKLGESPTHLSVTMHRGFVEFIRGGDPGWMPINAEAGPVRIFDNLSTVEMDAFTGAAIFANVWTRTPDG